MKIYLTIIFTCFGLSVLGQNFELYRGDTINRIDSRGLRYGRWLFFRDNKCEMFYEGNYKIIKRNDLINKVSSATTSYMNSQINEDYQKEFFFSTYKDSLFSVLDGYWINYTSNFMTGYDEIETIEYFVDGYSKSRKSIRNGIIVSEYKSTYKSTDSTEIYDTYNENDTLVTKRTIYKGDHKIKSLCYPENPLSINQCEISFEGIFNSSIVTEIELKSNSDNPIDIQQFIKTNSDYTILNQSRQVIDSLRINPRETVKLQIVLKPHRYNLSYQPKLFKSKRRRYTLINEDTITLIIAQANYNLYLKTNIYDIGPKNWKQKTFKFKKEANKPLIIIFEYLSDHNYFSLYDKSPRNKEIKALKSTHLDDVGGLGVMDLSNLEKGKYYLEIRAFGPREISIIEIE